MRILTSCYSNGCDSSHRRRCADSPGIHQVSTVCTSKLHDSLDPRDSSAQTAFRSVQPFAQGLVVCPTDRHTQRPRCATMSAAIARIPRCTCDGSQITLLIAVNLEVSKLLDITIYDMCDMRCYFNVRSKADISQLNLPHGTDN